MVDENDGIKDDSERDSTWMEYRRLILRELARLNSGILILERKIDVLEENIRKETFLIEDRQNKAIRNLEIAVAMLQVKSGVWGALAGGVASIGTTLALLLGEIWKK